MQNTPKNWLFVVLEAVAVGLAVPAAAAPHTGKMLAGESQELLSRVVSVASRLLDEAKISYVYGGYQVGDSGDCASCNSCLDTKKPKPSDRLKACSVCTRCSLDCSHFTALVYKDAGAPYPYLATPTMLDSSAETLRKQYGLVDFGTAASEAAPGDLLVYDGHVVLLERVRAPVQGLPRWRGDVVHATGGKDVKGGGQGVQRERFVDLETFRGPLRRILRHQRLAAGSVATAAPEPSSAGAPSSSAAAPLPKTYAEPPKTSVKTLRPVVKKPRNGD